ncbi:adenine glycosylase [Anaerotardibacter muris]|uniref:adenine glycosylase n=1 Tax=Anaerotardibacter muris TaxID=2941505 RepID=UPI00203F736F|nr:adenine glycosylase [Anaerotardibacter muris]
MAKSHERTFTDAQLDGFIEKVWREGGQRYRDLPWRNIEDPYAVLVSEIMLQQTQVSRVEKHWNRFLEVFPTLKVLAAADVSLVLENWQGLGYNRRALALKRTAEQCVAEYGGALPSSEQELLALPGIGKATAGGVMAFAFQKPALYLETNVRTVFLHELFPGEEGVSDKTFEPLVWKTCSKDDPRGWYYALLDYGAYLKSITVNPSRRSKHYTKQSAFEGSNRQKRAEIVRIVLANPGIKLQEAKNALDDFEKQKGRPPVEDKQFMDLVKSLTTEGFFTHDESTNTLRS